MWMDGCSSVLSWREKLTPAERKCAVYTTETKKKNASEYLLLVHLSTKHLASEKHLLIQHFPIFSFFLHVIAPP